MAETKDAIVEYFAAFEQYRKQVRYTLLGILIVFIILINGFPDFFTNPRTLIGVLMAMFLYMIIYSLFIAKYLRTPLMVMVGASTILAWILLFVYLSGGTASIFIGVVFAFTLSVGILVGRPTLIFFGVLLQMALISFAVVPGPAQPNHGIATQLLQQSIINAICFLSAYMFAGEYARKQAAFTEVTTVATEQKKVGEEKDELIAIVSHEFRTPLTAIKGYTDLLRKHEAVKSNEEVNHYIKYIQANLSKLDSIVEKTINVSVMDAGTLSLFFQPVTIEKLVADTLDETMQMKAEMKKLTLNLDLPQTRLPMISGDPQFLRLVVLNLVDDAIKYTDEGTVTVKLAQEGDSIVFTVSDTGRGIAETHLPHLFQKFYRADDYKTRTTEGSGLGLYLTKHIIERHNGTIAVTSTLNKGTTFTVHLPIAKTDTTWTQ